MDNKFEQVLLSNNIPLPTPPYILRNNEFTRYGPNSKRYWLVPIGNGYAFGDHVLGISKSWFPQNNNLDPEEIKERVRKFKEAAKEAKKQKEQEQLQVSLEAFAEYGNFSDDCTPSTYLFNKRVPNYPGVKFSRNYQYSGSPVLIIPAYDLDYKLWTYQTISNTGKKRFKAGGKKKGCCFIIGNILSSQTVYLNEGYATAASIYLATGITTLACFDIGNIEPVLQDIRRKYPNLESIIVADNDKWKDINTGKITAKKLFKKYGVKFALPNFRSEYDNRKPTDFNDLHIMQGIEEVRRQLQWV